MWISKNILKDAAFAISSPLQLIYLKLTCIVSVNFVERKYQQEPDSIALIRVNSLACVNGPIGFNGLFTPVHWDYSHT